MRDEVTPLVLTYNEGPNLARTIGMLEWAPTVVVVDSFSTDETLDIAHSFSNVRVIQRQFDTFAEQCNFGLEQIHTNWVLSLDSDYVLTNEFVKELHQLSPSEAISGYQARFQYCVFGYPLRGSLYPPRTVLYRKSRAKYQNEGHGHRVNVSGEIVRLAAPILHDDRKSLDRWLASQRTYARLEGVELEKLDGCNLNWRDRLRSWIWPSVPAVFLYTLFAKGCIIDGWPGWYYAMQRTYFEVLVSLELIDRRLRRVQKPTSEASVIRRDT